MAMTPLETNMMYFFAIGFVISILINIILFYLVSKYGKRIWVLLKAKKMKDPSWVTLIYSKRKVKTVILDAKDNKFVIDGKTYLIDVDKAYESNQDGTEKIGNKLIEGNYPHYYFNERDARPLEFSEMSQLLDPKILTKSLELAEMAGGAGIFDRLFEELKKFLIPFCIVIIIAIIIVALVAGGLYNPIKNIDAKINLLTNITKTMARTAIKV